MLQRLLAALLRLRSEMSHFATNLQYYVQFEVMEASWQVRRDDWLSKSLAGRHVP